MTFMVSCMDRFYDAFETGRYSMFDSDLTFILVEATRQTKYLPLSITYEGHLHLPGNCVDVVLF